MSHVTDMVASYCHKLGAIISVYDEPTVLLAIREARQKCKESWYVKLVEAAKDRSSDVCYRDWVLCKLIGDHFAPIVPRDDVLVQIILCDIHASALGGHLAEAKMLAKAKSMFYWQNIKEDTRKFCKECLVC